MADIAGKSISKGDCTVIRHFLFQFKLDSAKYIDESSIGNEHWSFGHITLARNTYACVAYGDFLSIGVKTGEVNTEWQSRILVCPCSNRNA